MALKAPKGNGDKKEFVKQPDMEAGVYPARLVQVIDYGLQKQRDFQGAKVAPKPEIGFTYELVDCFMVDENGEEIPDKPRWVSETLPFYGLFADKAKSTQRLKALDPDDAFDGDVAKMIGTPINVTIVINKKGDKTYVNVANIAAMRPRDAAKCPELVNDPKVFDLDAPDIEVFSKFPEWVRDKIKSNLNFKGSKLEKLLGGDAAKAGDQNDVNDPPFDVDDNDDNPY